MSSTETSSQVNQDSKQERRLLDAILDILPDVLYTIDLVQSKLLMSNRDLPTVLGYLPEDKIESGTGFYGSLLHPEDLSLLPARLEKYQQALDGAVIETEYRLKHANGSWRWFRSRDTIFQRGADGKPTQVLGIAQDITVQKLLQEKLWYLNTRDALTDLYNRDYFDGELERMKKSRHFPVSVVVMSVAGLKELNQKYGYTAGDEMLRRAAVIFSKAFRAEDVVARVGGNEFAVLLSETNSEIAARVIERVRSYCREHNLGRSKEDPLNLAIGVATAEASALLTHAHKEAHTLMQDNKLHYEENKNAPIS